MDHNKVKKQFDKCDLVYDYSDNTTMIITKIQPANKRKFALCQDSRGRSYWYSAEQALKFLRRLNE